MKVNAASAQVENPVTNGVNQGCVLAPTLFSLMLSARLTDDALGESNPGINITFRTYGKLFNPRRLEAATNVKETVPETFSSLTTAPSTPVKSRKCKPRWTAFLQPATTSASPLALKRLR